MGHFQIASIIMYTLASADQCNVNNFVGLITQIYFYIERKQYVKLHKEMFRVTTYNIKLLHAIQIAMLYSFDEH